MKEKINKLFKEYNIELENNELEMFEKFLDIFIKTNSEINLSAIRETEDIIVKHFIDSVMLNAFFEFTPWKTDKLKILDLGTGWWFPLIPLAIINDKNIDFYWLDSVWKKLKVVQNFANILWLSNIETINSRAEEAWQDPKYREQFDYAVSRATAFFPVLLEYVIPLLKVWWIFCAYKLEDKEELKSTKKALSRLWAKILKVKNYEIMWQKRVIIFIEKISQTHKKYPRKVWIPMSKPII